MSARRVFRPGMGVTPAERMRSHLAGIRPPGRRERPSAEVLHEASVQGLAVLERAGTWTIADSAAGQVLREGLDAAGVKRYVRAEPELRDRTLYELSDKELLEQAGPGARLERLDRVRQRDRDLAGAGIELKRCTGNEAMAPAKFVGGGPLAGQRHLVPRHAPAWVRFAGRHWYAHKHNTVRTYTYVAGWSP